MRFVLSACVSVYGSSRVTSSLCPSQRNATPSAEMWTEQMPNTCCKSWIHVMLRSLTMIIRSVVQSLYRICVFLFWLYSKGFANADLCVFSQGNIQFIHHPNYGGCCQEDWNDAEGQSPGTKVLFYISNSFFLNIYIYFILIGFVSAGARREFDCIKWLRNVRPHCISIGGNEMKRKWLIFLLESLKLFFFTKCN